MASRRRVILQVLAYTLYGLAVLLVLVYATFPYDLLRQRLVDTFTQDDVRLSIARLQPGFPLGLTLHNVRLLTDSRELSGAMMQLRTIHVRPVWLSLLSGAPQAHFDGALYSGYLSGVVRSSTGNDTTTWEIEGSFASLQVERHPWLQNGNNAMMRGQLEGDFTFTLRDDGQMQQGTLDFRFQPIVFTGSQGLQAMLKREITCDTLQSQLKMTSSQLQIASFNCKGDDLSIQARGTVNWQHPLQNSSLNLHLQIRSETAYRDELALIGGLVRRPPDRRGVLSFSIRGTMRQPRIGA